MSQSKSSFLVRNFLKYSVIFGEGVKGDSAYLLKEGRVEISKMMDGKKKVFAILKPVSMFGEMAILLGDEKRTATAVALEDSKVVEIKKDDFESYIRQSPAMISTLLNVLVQLSGHPDPALHVLQYQQGEHRQGPADTRGKRHP